MAIIGEGAGDNIESGFTLTQRGLSVFLPSMPGYGNSSGAKDYCGPNTQSLILKSITQLIATFGFQKLGLWGISRGATLSGCLAVKTTLPISCLVLQSGAYDLAKDYSWPNKPAEIKTNMTNETKGEIDPWVSRSSLSELAKLSCPTLILHGKQDDHIDVNQSLVLDNLLTSLHKDHQTVILDNSNHYLTSATLKTYTLPFLLSHLS